jgi:hypothetical protein
VYDVAGPVPDYQRARRRREKRPSERMELDDVSEKGEDDDESVEEDGVYDQGGPCTLERVEMEHLAFDTAINHCSLSPDGRWLVAVGDTNEVHLLQAQSDGTFLPYHRFEASNDASFSTDWSSTGDKFAVASQGELEPRRSFRAAAGQLADDLLPCIHTRWLRQHLRHSLASAVLVRLLGRPFDTPAAHRRDPQGDSRRTSRRRSQVEV